MFTATSASNSSATAGGSGRVSPTVREPPNSSSVRALSAAAARSRCAGSPASDATEAGGGAVAGAASTACVGVFGQSRGFCCENNCVKGCWPAVDIESPPRVVCGEGRPRARAANLSSPPLRNNIWATRCGVLK
eukprot:scaffold71682_cov63-Phaeocystis_antarctica.AAC.3